jgi:hypothetical protein
MDISEIFDRQKDNLAESDKMAFDVKLSGRNPSFFTDIIRKTPFQVWPVGDSDFTAFFTIFASHYPKIPVVDFGKMDDLHWRFLFKNHEHFELIEFDDYRLQNTRKLAKLTDVYINRLFTPCPECDFTSNPPSLLFSILSGELPTNVFLLTSFFRFTTVGIPQDQFSALFEFAVRSGDADLILAAIQYSARKRLTFSREVLIDNGMDVLRQSSALAQDLSVRLMPSEFPLPETIDFTGLDSADYDLRIVALALNGAEYLRSFLAPLKIKSSNLIFLCKLFSRFQPPLSLICEYCSLRVHSLKTRPKRLACMIRLLRVAVEWAKHIPQRFDWLFQFSDSESVVFHVEFGKFLLRIASDQESLKQFAGMHSQFQSFAPYLGIASYLYCCATPSIELPEAVYLTFLSSDHIPSVRIAALDAVELLVRGPPTVWPVFESIAERFFEILSDVHDQPLFGAKITPLLRAVVRQYEFGPRCVPGVCRLIFTLPKTSPCLPARIFLIPMFSSRLAPDDQHYIQFMSSVIRSSECMTFGLPILLDYTKWVFDHMPDESKREEVGHWVVRPAVQFLASAPTDENMKKFLETIFLAPCPKEVSADAIWGLATIEFPPLKLIFMARIFQKQCKPHDIALCLRKIEELSKTGNPIFVGLAKMFHGEALEAAEIACRPL